MMAENVTPVVLAVDGFAEREVMMVDYKFDQATDREGQIAGIPRGGQVTVRVKAMNDGNNQLIAWMLDPTSPKDFSVKFTFVSEWSLGLFLINKLTITKAVSNNVFML